MTPTVDVTSFHAIYYERNRDGSPLINVPQGILMHTGEGTAASDLYILSGKDPARRVGCNYYVRRNATIYRLAPDSYECWHAGAATQTSTRWWGNNAAAYGIINGNRLIGVETEHRAGQDWPEVQLDAIAWLFRQKIQQYGFPLTRIGAHKWYAPGRKQDPSDFPDDKLQAFFRSLYAAEPVADGGPYRVTSEAGARIRQGPGTTFPVAATLPDGYVFWSDGTTVGEAVAGNSNWVHFAGPTPTIPNPLGFVSMAICEKVPA